VSRSTIKRWRGQVQQTSFPNRTLARPAAPLGGAISSKTLA